MPSGLPTFRLSGFPASQLPSRERSEHRCYHNKLMDFHPVHLVPHARTAWAVGGSPQDLAKILGARFSFFPKQVHGTFIEWVDAPIAFGLEADGLLTDAADLLIGVRTADCLPIVLAHRTEPFVGAIHAGWRGLAAGIVDQTAMRVAESGWRPADLVAYLGPCIGPCCYEVGPEVGKSFGRHFNGKLLDLKGFARERLGSIGLPDGSITEETACTRCTSALPSYRRDPSCGRILTGIVIQNDNGCHP